jgi:hypothetical protein
MAAIATVALQPFIVGPWMSFGVKDIRLSAGVFSLYLHDVRLKPNA